MKKKTFGQPQLGRRQFIKNSSMGLAGLSSASLGLANASDNKQSKTTLIESPKHELHGPSFELIIAETPINISGKQTTATTVNGSMPGPTLICNEGDTVTIKVTNKLSVQSSIHWHGIILPTDMDGVPGLSFDGIAPGETFTYSFTLNQSGTYWYHSHSGFQEQTGVMGALIIKPKHKIDEYDDEAVMVLSDWADAKPQTIYANLKKMSHYYNFSERTLADTMTDIDKDGFLKMWDKRSMWNNMRMSDRDISDVTGYEYHYLLNGQPNSRLWNKHLKAGSKLLIRVINASAMTIFDIRIPNVRMTIVASDGQPIRPVEVDEFRIGVAETYDILFEVTDENHLFFAQAIDRSGYTAGYLLSNSNELPSIPELDPMPILTHRDMGMDHSSMGHSTEGSEMDHSMMDHSSMDMSKSDKDSSAMQVMHHSSAKLAPAGDGSDSPITHAETEFGPHVDMRAEVVMSGIDDPGIGLRNHKEIFKRKVLTYADILNRYETDDKREPSREIHIHLTGNMSRYMWSINGVKHADAEPIILHEGERVRFVVINDTMMTHPIHLHGLWSELETGNGHCIPRKHTVLVQPASKASYLVTADSVGRWAYHCHLMYHMPGMMREVRVLAKDSNVEHEEMSHD